MHVYDAQATPITFQFSAPVLDKAHERLFVEGAIVEAGKRTRSGVLPFHVPSESTPGDMHTVEVDTQNQTMRCPCEAGFHGIPCHHMAMVCLTDSPDQVHSSI